MLSHAALINQLADLGVGGRTPLMVHASLRRVGPIEGGADTLLDALFESLGPDGTLLMALGADGEVPFDALMSPAEKDMGVLAEVFRRRAGTRVNDHAASRFGAAGPRSVDLLEPTPLHDYHGPGSVISRLAAFEGWVLRLGADLDTVTLTHWAEYIANVPEKRHVRIRYVRADIGEQWIESLDDTEGIRGEGEYFPQILVDFLAAGKARIGPVGYCTAELFAAPMFVDFAVTWMETKFGSQDD
jgi:aminoglycoside N3'-acetyltransferase